MKSLKLLTLLAMVPLYMLSAGEKNPGEQEAWLKQAIAKETQRAQEAVKQHSDTERMAQKYGWAKDKNPELYTAMLEANKKAAESWSTVARQCETATNPETLMEAKQATNAAAANAYQAELTLKYAAAAMERRHMTEKSGDPQVTAIAAQLDANEKALLQANLAKNEAAMAAEKLQNENRTLTKSLHEAYKKAREAQSSEPPKKADPANPKD